MTAIETRIARKVPDQTGKGRSLYRLHPAYDHEGFPVATVEIRKEHDPFRNRTTTSLREASTGRLIREWQTGVPDDVALASIRCRRGV